MPNMKPTDPQEWWGRSWYYDDNHDDDDDEDDDVDYDDDEDGDDAKYELRNGEVELLLLVLELGAEQTEAEARCCKESGEIVHVGDDDADDDDVGDDDE